MCVPHISTALGEKCRIKGGYAPIIYGAQNLSNGVISPPKLLSLMSVKSLLINFGTTVSYSDFAMWDQTRCAEVHVHGQKGGKA